MVIIFDGLDRTGKSTQIKLLMKYLIDDPTYVIHFTNIPGISSQQSKNYSKMLYNDMFKFIEDNSKIYKRNIIFDRSHIGEYVYAPMYRNYIGSFIYNIEKKYENTPIFKDIFLFVCVDEAENLLRREDGHSLSSNSSILKVHEIKMFESAFNLSLIKNKLLININNKSIETVHNEIIQFIKDRTNDDKIKFKISSN